jgi:outer membrane protein TolC
LKSKNLSKLLCVATLGLMSLPSSADSQESTPTVLTPFRVLETTLQNNPQIQQAAFGTAAAKALLDGEEQRYPWTLLGDAGYRNQEEPSLGLIESGLRKSESFGSGLQLVKELVFGTRFSAEIRWDRTKLSVPYRLPSLGIESVETIGPNHTGTLRLSLEQPLLRGSGRAQGQLPIQRARGNWTLARRQTERVVTESAQRALTSYWRWVEVRHKLAFKRQGLDRTKRLAKATLERIQAGQVAEVQRDLVEQRTYVSEQEILLLENEAQDAAEELRLVMGLPFDAECGTPPVDFPADKGDLDPIDVALQRARSRNVEIAIAEARIKIARKTEEIGLEATRPKLDAQLSWSQTSLTEEPLVVLEQIALLRYVGLFAGVVFEMQLGDNPLEATSQANRIERVRLESILDATLQSLERRIRAARRGLMTQRKRAELAEKEIDLARKNLETMRQKYAAGLSSSLEVLELEEQLQEAEVRQVNSRVSVLLARVSLESLQGTLLEAYGVTTDGP